jgi:uncharacterized membrane protein YesL
LAGFFGLFDFTKPGKGVDPNAPPKKPFFRFFELFWRKFTRFILLNLLLFLLFLPIITVVFRFFNQWVVSLDPDFYQNIIQQAEEQAANPPAEGEAAQGVVLFSILQDILFRLPVSLPFSSPATLGEWVFLFWLLLSLLLYGPVMCGFTYMLRNFVREEHAWMSDFFLRMKSNFKQGVALGLLELFALSMLILNLTMQSADGASGWTSFSVTLAKLISPLLMVIILFTRKYMYLMAVTFNISVFNIIKNSLAFSIVGLLRNALVLVIEAALIFAVFFIPMGDFLLLPFFFFSFTGFLSVFAVYPLIHKHMILPSLKRESGEDAETGDET